MLCLAGFTVECQVAGTQFSEHGVSVGADGWFTLKSTFVLMLSVGYSYTDGAAYLAG